MTIALRAAICDFARLAGTLIGGLARAGAFVLIWAYRLLIRPLFPTSCRFEPSCSEYALQAVARFGALRGGWLALKRLGRCNPWGPWGADPVPETTASHTCSHHHAV
jgi:putative membrane protein insertion efficiency factor